MNVCDYLGDNEHVTIMLMKKTCVIIFVTKWTCYQWQWSDPTSRTRTDRTSSPGPHPGKHPQCPGCHWWSCEKCCGDKFYRAFQKMPIVLPENFNLNTTQKKLLISLKAESIRSSNWPYLSQKLLPNLSFVCCLFLSCKFVLWSKLEMSFHPSNSFAK